MPRHRLSDARGWMKKIPSVSLSKRWSGDLNILAKILTGFEERSHLSKVILEISGDGSRDQ